jgi:GNAT superfamily N-acetyltransferase
MTQAFGIAMREPVTSGDIDRLEEFYRSRGSAVNIEVCPYSDGSLLDAIGSRGYRAFEFSNVHVRQLSSDDCDNRSGRADITARSIDPGEEGIWCRTLVRGFLTGPEIRKEWLDLFAAYCAVEGVTCFLAELDREPIGGGLVLIRDGVAALAATSTLPNRRNLGAQTALLKARLAFAVERNCKLAMVTTMPGTTSERNVQRHGFRVVYTRCKFIREWGSRSPAE